ncbi:guanylate kinase [uncultured Capnocytophaga sp.]|jgi:guanylate kinase|uniref:guanylate kinase n=1 Tax=uncultured Capnocytophaga sp. TaxID=159273 RepID=UPI000F0DE0A9|nr:guanylate kinase [uncultured Capnocytophaga sp.]RKW06766.1 MAG: guanylate kinase [Capnocytophaga sp.]
MSSRIIIFSAPSGSGKSSIIKELLKEEDLNLAFSISTTSRIPRGKEQNGVEYYFISVDEFKEKIDKQAFIEWQEVYAGNFYGTYQSEIDRLSSLGKNIVFDLDVFGGINLKKIFGKQALSIFIQPPSLEELKKRLEKRNTETIEKIQIRIDKAKYELEQSVYFDRLIINEDLSESVKEASQMIRNFLKDSEL